MKNSLIFLALLCLNFGYSQVGINTETPQSTLDVNGNISFKTQSYNGGPGGSATPISDGYFLLLSPTSGNTEFILPDAATVPGRMYIMRNNSSTLSASIFSFGGNFFASDSTSSTTSATLLQTSITKTMYFYSDGANWIYGSYGF